VGTRSRSAHRVRALLDAAAGEGRRGCRVHTSARAWRGGSYRHESRAKNPNASQGRQHRHRREPARIQASFLPDHRPQCNSAFALFTILISGKFKIHYANCRKQFLAKKGEINVNPMQSHVKVLAILHIIFGVLGVLIALGVFVFLGGIAGVIQHDNDPDAAEVVPILGAIGGLVLLVLLALSIPGIAAGVGLLSYQPWARILTIVLSILDLINIPFGTALGVYGLWVLFTAEGAQLFEQRPTMQYQR